MIQVWERRMLPNEWQGRALDDPRFADLQALMLNVCDIADHTEHGAKVETFLRPLELVRVLRAAADQIEDMTG